MFDPDIPWDVYRVEAARVALAIIGDRDPERRDMPRFMEACQRALTSMDLPVTAEHLTAAWAAWHGFLTGSMELAEELVDWEPAGRAMGAGVDIRTAFDGMREL